jgi:hypothetical protein
MKEDNVMKVVAPILVLLLGVGFCTQDAGAADTVDRARAQRRGFRDAYMKKILAEPVKHPLVYALAALYTGEDLKGGNEQIRKALAVVAGKDGMMTAKEASAEKVKWCMRGSEEYLAHPRERKP